MKVGIEERGPKKSKKTLTQPTLQPKHFRSSACQITSPKSLLYKNTPSLHNLPHYSTQNQKKPSKFEKKMESDLGYEVHNVEDQGKNGKDDGTVEVDPISLLEKV